MRDLRAHERHAHLARQVHAVDELPSACSVPFAAREYTSTRLPCGSFVCAYTALYYWTHGTTRCRVAGDLDHGYIVTPVTPELGACLDRVAAEAPAAPLEGIAF